MAQSRIESHCCASLSAAFEASKRAPSCVGDLAIKTGELLVDPNGGSAVAHEQDNLLQQSTLHIPGFLDFLHHNEFYVHLHAKLMRLQAQSRPTIDVIFPSQKQPRASLKSLPSLSLCPSPSALNGHSHGDKEVVTSQGFI